MVFIISKDEKKILIILGILLLLVILITIYNSRKIYKDKNKILNSKIIFIDSSSTVNDFEDNFNQNKKIGKTDFTRILCTNNMNNWNNIAEKIYSSYNMYNSFVVYCDSNEIVNAASSLSFILENLGKPVILTCSDNITDTLKITSKTKINEVMIEVDKKLIRGCRSKISKNEIVSYNYPLLDKSNSLSFPTENLQLKKINPSINIIVIKLYDNFDVNSISIIPDEININGIILENNYKNLDEILHILLKFINIMTKKGIPIIYIDKINDEPITELLETNIAYGNDMTRTTAITKLMFLLTYVNNIEVVNKLAETSLRGEITNENFLNID